MGAVRQGDSVSRPARDSTTTPGSSSRHDKPSASSLRRHLQRFPHASVLVIGDLILDHYVWGRVSRISPEAPVPVVHVESESMRLGGAANVFNNILALGGKADLCGMIGSDEAGRLLLKELGCKRAGHGGKDDQGRERPGRGLLARALGALAEVAGEADALVELDL